MNTALKSVPGPEWELREVEVSKIKVDPHYQRTTKGQRRIDKIAAAWDWYLYEPVILSFRDGYYFAVVGQHRVLAARKAGIKTLPALVHYGRTSQDEAFTFTGTDTYKVGLTRADHHKADVHQGVPLALRVDAIIHAHGHAGFTSKAAGSLRAAKTAYLLQKSEVLDKTLSVTDVWQREDGTWPPFANDGQVLRAIGEFFRRYPSVPVDEVAKACARHNPGELRVAGFGGRSASDGWRLVREWYNRGRSTTRLGSE